MAYDYKRDDIFYDVESLSNVFTVAWWLPNPDVNAIILSYIDDDNILTDKSHFDYIKQHIYNMYPRLKETNTQIVFEDVAFTGRINEYSNAQVPSKLGFQTFAKRMGLTNITTYLNAAVDKRHLSGGGNEYNPAYYPVKHTDPDYDEDEHGYRFGYNSTNYDMTMLAQILGQVHDKYYTEEYAEKPVEWDIGEPITAKTIRAFNDELFDSKWRSSMAMRLAHDPDGDRNSFGDFKKPGWIMRKGWQMTGRHIDVARLNEKLQMVGLKRILGMLGLQIMESDKLDSTGVIRTVEEFADLFAYNISDVVNLQLLFEHKVYQNSFIVRGSLLETYPATVYDQKKGFSKKGQQNKVDDGNYMNIRRDRLARDSTSAKFVELAIAPYAPIKDVPVVSYLYPSKQEAIKLGIEQVDVLEQTKEFFESTVTSDVDSQPHKDFMQIYAFYKGIEGRNFNTSKAYEQQYGQDTYETQDRPYISSLMTNHNTNLFYHNKDEQGVVHRSSCLANFSIGGIHGAEVNMKEYNKDLALYYEEKEVQDYIQSLYDSATTAINGPVRIEYPEHLPVPDRIKDKIRDDGTIRIREFMKGNSRKIEAFWRDVPEVKLYEKRDSGNWAVRKRYTYVSVGASHHEDFTSYYPLLLSRLSAFINPDYHGYNEDGSPADPYYEMFLTRMERRAVARDKSQPEEVRIMADLDQESRKLLINAASGAGDATFDNNIRANNAVISMRVIGQLFAWRIGQAQTMAGARVPSTNTDGLYTMDISAEVNDRILEEISKDMHIGIEPERLERFVSKDSNNRLEVKDGKVTSASGGTLNSWGGPQPTQSLDHAAIIDHMLVRYLADTRLENPADVPFDKEFARKMFDDFIADSVKDDKIIEALLFFQWIVSSAPGKQRYVYKTLTNKHTGQRDIKILQQYNRVFLLKEQGFGNIKQQLHLATKRAINPATFNKRKKEYSNGERAFDAIHEHDADALYVLEQNNFDLITENGNPQSSDYRGEAKTHKVKSMPDGQHVGIYNDTIVDLPKDKALQMLQALDTDAYLDILENTFQSWSNLA